MKFASLARWFSNWPIGHGRCVTRSRRQTVAFRRQIRIGSDRHEKTVRPARRRRDAQRSGTRYRLRVVTIFENA